MDAESVPDGVARGAGLRGRLRQHRHAVSALHRMLDMGAILGGLALACTLAGDHCSAPVAVAGLSAGMLFVIFGEAKNLYRSWRLGAIREELWYVLEAWLGGVGLSLLGLFLWSGGAAQLGEPLRWWFAATPLLLMGWRLVGRHGLRFARARGLNTRRLAVVGSGELARHVEELVAANAWTGFRVVGLFDHEAQGEGRSLEALLRLARHGGVDVIYVTLAPDRIDGRLERLLADLGDSTISTYLILDRRSRPQPEPESGIGLLPRLPWLHHCRIDYGGLAAVSIYETPFLGPGGFVKRLEDILVSGAALTLLALPMLIIAAGVKLTSPGPVLFKQRRYGLDGREIVVWKFRSMRVCEDGAEIRQAQRGDARLTRFGAFLRRTSLDELPQFINVLTGSMSVVGPRPHAVAHNEYYRGLVGGYMLRHKVKPGITGWAQVHGLRGETDTLDKMRWRVELDLAYIRSWSLWLDMRIIGMTVVGGMVHRNAY